MTHELLQVTRPDQLFTGVAAQAKREYHELAREWHPDTNPDTEAAAVFAHITALYQEATQRIAAGTWEGAGFVSVQSRQGLTTTVDFLRSHPMELGRVYVGTDHLTYLIDPEHRGLISTAENRTRNYVFPNDTLRAQLEPCLPAGHATTELADGRFLVQVVKPAGLLLLRDVAASYGILPSRHVAWVLSRLYNLACYFEFAKVSHQNLGLDTVFIDPATHVGAVFGGWWYTTPIGSRVTQVPVRTFTYLPWSVRTSKQASALTDQELIRATGRELLGDVSGARLPATVAPGPMVAWLTRPATGTALDNYRAWGNVLQESFGPRRFTVMDRTSDSVYPTKKEYTYGRRSLHT